MAIVTFAPAVRKGAHVIITAYGESGCGKTYSLIKLGRGLVGPKGRLALLDTETGRGMIYAKLGYDYAELTPPYTPERYIEAINAAEEAGIEALIIDSGSHEWEGMGGVLEIADSGRSRNDQPLEGLVKWAKPKARHKKYVQRLLQSRMHLLISLRAKERMVQLTAKDVMPKGSRVGDIVSDGFVPIQDKRFIFETTVQLFLPASGEHGVPVVEKCPEDLLGAFPDGERISDATGQKIAEWVAGGEPIDHGAAELKRDAEDAAGRGIDALRSFWRALPKADQVRIKSMSDNLTSIANDADQEAEERRREKSNAHRQFLAADDANLSPTAADEPEPDAEGQSTPIGKEVMPHPEHQPGPDNATAPAGAGADHPDDGLRPTFVVDRIMAGRSLNAKATADALVAMVESHVRTQAHCNEFHRVNRDVMSQLKIANPEEHFRVLEAIAKDRE